MNLQNPPADTVTRVQYRTNIVVSSWDGTIRLYRRLQDAPEVYQLNAPVLDVCFGEGDDEIFAGLLTGEVIHYSFSTKKARILYRHQSGAKCVCYGQGVLMSGSWDKSVIFYANGQTRPVKVPSKVYCMDYHDGNLVVGLSERQTLIFDVSKFNLDTPIEFEVYQSQLKQQLRSLKVRGDVFVSASVEARVSIDFFSKEDGKKYAYRCHRLIEQDIEVIQPINAIDFHPNFGTFATGGSDSTVIVWDGKLQKKLKTFEFQQPVSSLAFSSDGKKLVVACSDVINGGPSQLIINILQEEDVKPRQKAVALK